MPLVLCGSRNDGRYEAPTALYRFCRICNVEKYICGSNVTDPVCGVSGNMGFPDNADATAGQNLSCNAFFKFAHATTSKTLTAITLPKTQYSLFFS